MKRRALALAMIVLLAAGLRVGAIVATGATHAPPEENRIIARNLAAGRGFTFTQFGVTGPTAIRGPAYPMLLALVGPDRVTSILTINVVAGAMSVAAAFALVTCLLIQPAMPAADSLARVARASAPWVAAIAFAVWPTQVYAATLTQGLSIAVFLTLAAVAFAVRRTPPATIASGVAAGLATLTEPVLALPLILVAVALARHRRWPDAALYLGTAAVIVAPWLYRNAIVFGRPMPLTSNFWRDAFLGNGSEVTGFHWGPVTRPATAAKDPITRLPAADFDRLKVAEPTRDGVFRAWAAAWIAAHPTRYANLCVSRFFDTLCQSRDFDLGRRPAAWFVYALTRALAALVPFLLWLLLLSYRRVATEPFLWCVLFMVGLAFVPAMTVASARNAVLMDVPQFLAIAALCGVIGSSSRSRLSTDGEKP